MGSRVDMWGRRHQKWGGSRGPMEGRKIVVMGEVELEGNVGKQGPRVEMEAKAGTQCEGEQELFNKP